MNRGQFPPQPSTQPAGPYWVIQTQDKAKYDAYYASIDKNNRGYITGDEAVPFFGNSGLSEDILAQIWDLADINSEGHLNRDEFAVAMHLIRQQKSKRDGGGSLPASLPADLVPPNMRNQTHPVARTTTAPTFDALPTMPKSAAQDLFGLDDFTTTTAPEQEAASTGGSSSFARSQAAALGASRDPLTPSSPQSSQHSPQSSTMFKQFVPSSSFGQNMMTSMPSTASTTSSTQSRGLPSQQNTVTSTGNLLDDNDPEVSKRLTTETTDLANLSNQVGILSSQMEEVKTQKTTTESELSQASSQKREFELRLSQLRTQYEQEVKEVKGLQERLAASRGEKRKLQQDIALIEGTRQDLQNTLRTLVSQLQADQRENANLKDRIRMINNEISQLKPQLDKTRSEARQQKGLVVISKKQLATSESERDSLKNEYDDLTRQSQEHERSMSTTLQTSTQAAVASPTPSTTSQNTNPFFRRTGMSESGVSSPPPQAQPSQSSFDNVFGSGYSTGPRDTGFSQTSKPDSQSRDVPPMSDPSGGSVRSSEGGINDLTPSTSPLPSSYHESPRPSDPPLSLESRQIPSGFMPFSNVQRVESFGSSAKASTQATRYGNDGTETPTNWASSTVESPVQERDIGKSLDRSDIMSKGDASVLGSQINFATSSETNESMRSASKPSDAFHPFGSSSGTKDTVPGAFPGDINSPILPTPTGESTMSDRSKASNRADQFGQARGPTATAAKDEFDAAFAQLGGSKLTQERQSTGGSSADSAGTSSASASKFNQEFPPIHEYEKDDDSDSGEERGFADNFTDSTHHRHGSSDQNQSHSRGGSGATGSNLVASDPFTARPLTGGVTSTSSMLPASSADKSPKDPNQFPSDFTGLLPVRQDLTSHGAQGSPEKVFSQPLSGGQTLFGGSQASKAGTSAAATAFSSSPPLSSTPLSTAPSDLYQSAQSHPSASKGPSPTSHPAPPTKPQPAYVEDEFDREFVDLTEAKEGDDKDDEFVGPSHREAFEDFNPVFDSPAPSKSTLTASNHTPTGSQIHSSEDHFNDFEHNIGSADQTKVISSTTAIPTASPEHWDAIFAPVSSSSGKPPVPAKQELSPVVGSSSAATAASGPPLGRVLSSGTDQDDTILMKLTGMGYQRDVAVGALERSNYDVNKVSSMDAIGE
jgi:epidermal growth factor receptor substrate 15